MEKTLMGGIMAFDYLKITAGNTKKRCGRCGFYYEFDNFGIVLINGIQYPDDYCNGCRKYLEQMGGQPSMILVKKDDI